MPEWLFFRANYMRPSGFCLYDLLFWNFTKSILWSLSHSWEHSKSDDELPSWSLVNLIAAWFGGRVMPLIKLIRTLHTEHDTPWLPVVGVLLSPFTTTPGSTFKLVSVLSSPARLVRHTPSRKTEKMNLEQEICFENSLIRAEQLWQTDELQQIFLCDSFHLRGG